MFPEGKLEVHKFGQKLASFLYELNKIMQKACDEWTPINEGFKADIRKEDSKNSFCYFYIKIYPHNWKNKKNNYIFLRLSPACNPVPTVNENSHLYIDEGCIRHDDLDVFNDFPFLVNDYLGVFTIYPKDKNTPSEGAFLEAICAVSKI
jgi:hypothetical protein